MGRFELLCSSGAFIGRRNGRDHRLFLDIYDTLASDGIEFMMYESWYEKIDGIISDFLCRGVRARTLHADKMIGERLGQNDVNNALQLFLKNCEIANSLGAKTVVLHLWNGPSSDDNIERNLSALPRLYEIADTRRLTLAVENVVCRNGDPLEYFYKITRAHPYARFTLDTKMSAFHGTLDRVYSPEMSFLWGKIAHLHINDYAGGVKDWERLKTLHIGEGNIDFDRFFKFISEIGYTGTLTLECTSMGEGGELYPEKMNESIRKVREFLI